VIIGPHVFGDDRYAEFIEGRHKEGDMDYQAARFARAALRSLRGEDG
jgi:hypothetical protein